MTTDDYFRGPTGTRYTYAEIAGRIRKEAPQTLGKHISVQLEAIGLTQEMMNGTTPCGLPFTFAEAVREQPERTAVTANQSARFDIEHDPAENSDRVYVLVDGKFDVAIIRTDEGVVVDIYPRDEMEPVASTYAFDTDVETESPTN